MQEDDDQDEETEEGESWRDCGVVAAGQSATSRRPQDSCRGWARWPPPYCEAGAGAT